MRAWRALNKRKAADINEDLLRAVRAQGKLPETVAQKWAQADKDFLKDVLEPSWLRGMELGGNTVGPRISLYRRGKSLTPSGQYKPSTDKAAEWIKKRGLQLLALWGLTDMELLFALVFGAEITFTVGIESYVSVAQGAIGLSEVQMNWVTNRYEGAFRALIGDGMNPQEAAAAAAVQRDLFISRLQQQRALAIARTETTAAFNEGQLDAVREAQENGWLPSNIVKIWSVADDEACVDCLELDGTEIGIEDNFRHPHYMGGGQDEGLAPPLHVNCRCTLIYETRE